MSNQNLLLKYQVFQFVLWFCVFLPIHDLSVFSQVKLINQYTPDNLSPYQTARHDHLKICLTPSLFHMGLLSKTKSSQCFLSFLEKNNYLIVTMGFLLSGPTFFCCCLFYERTIPNAVISNYCQ